MFSNLIQNMLNSGGQAAAIQRAAQMNANLNKLYPVSTQNLNNKNIPNLTNSDLPVNLPTSFNDVLKSSMPQTVNFGNLLLNPKIKQVNAKLLNQNEITNINDVYDEIETLQNANINNTVAQVSSVNTTKNQTEKSASQLQNIISQVCEKHGVDEKLVNALIKQESNFNPKARSKAGAMGLMQLMPMTAKAMGVKDPYNTVQNVEGGVKYLKSMLDKYNGNVILALAAYNAGPTAVDKYSGVPPYKETQNYVKKVLANYI